MVETYHPNSLVKFRMRKGWSIREAAASAKMDGWTWACLERGEITLHDERAETLAQLFDCTVDQLRAECISPRKIVRPESRKNLNRGRSRWAGRLNIPKKAHPLVRRLFEILNDQHLVVSDIAERAGIKASTISDWRYRRSPSVQNFEAAINALGYELHIRQRREDK